MPNSAVCCHGGTGDVSATWRTAQRLLHSKHKAVYDDAESAKLVTTFCQFFVDKVNRIRTSHRRYSHHPLVVRLQSDHIKDRHCRHFNP